MLTFDAPTMPLPRVPSNARSSFSQKLLNFLDLLGVILRMVIFVGAILGSAAGIGWLLTQVDWPTVLAFANYYAPNVGTVLLIGVTVLALAGLTLKRRRPRRSPTPQPAASVNYFAA